MPSSVADSVNRLQLRFSQSAARDPEREGPEPVSDALFRRQPDDIASAALLVDGKAGNLSNLAVLRTLDGDGPDLAAALSGSEEVRAERRAVLARVESEIVGMRLRSDEALLERGRRVGELLLGTAPQLAHQLRGKCAPYRGHVVYSRITLNDPLYTRADID